MKKNIVNAQKHLSLSDRIVIETSLEKRMNFTEIGVLLHKDPTTISKEIRKHRLQQKGTLFNTNNFCQFMRDCQRINMCHRMCNVPCKSKKSCDCNKRCPHFERFLCSKLKKPPYVCNGCTAKKGCRKDKMYYRAEVSYDEYRELLSSSREGIHISAEELCQVDRLISPLLKKGQPVAHIYATYGNDIPFSQRTLYGHIDKGLLSVNNLDLPRKVRYKERGKPRRVAPDKAYKKGRAYKDFQEFLFLNPEVNVIEMDTVHGMVSGKALLTMLFRNCSFMLAFLIDEISQDAVTEVFKTLKESLTPPVFSKTFPVFLTDNGPEFFHWPTFLSCPDGEILSEIFYCDPNAAYQKGKLEKNHEFIRYVVPKGKPFDSLSQQKVNIMINHINSTKRASLNDSTPFGLAQKLLPEKLFEALDLKLIDPDQVVLKPILVKS